MIVLLCSIALADLTFEPALAEGIESVITVGTEDEPRRGETVRVVHRPGTVHERERAIGITDGRGRVRWTPEAAGVARLRVGDLQRPVHIAWRRPPSSAVVLLAVLALFSAGFALSGLRRIRRR